MGSSLLGDAARAPISVILSLAQAFLEYLEDFDEQVKKTRNPQDESQLVPVTEYGVHPEDKNKRTFDDDLDNEDVDFNDYHLHP